MSRECKPPLEKTHNLRQSIKVSSVVSNMSLGSKRMSTVTDSMSAMKFLKRNCYETWLDVLKDHIFPGGHTDSLTFVPERWVRKRMVAAGGCRRCNRVPRVPVVDARWVKKRRYLTSSDADVSKQHVRSYPFAHQLDHTSNAPEILV